MLPITLALYDTAGIQYIAEPQQLRFTKSFYGGIDVEMSFFLARPAMFDYPEIGHGQKVELWHGMTRKFLGVQREISVSKSEGQEGFNVRCMGYNTYLRDFSYGGKGKLWAENRYSEFRPVTAQENAQYRTQNVELGRDDRLIITLHKKVTPKPDKFYGLYYECPFDNIKKVSFSYEAQCLNDGKFLQRLFSYADGFTSRNAEWDNSTPGSGDVVATLSTERPIIVFAARDWGDPEWWEEDHYLEITNLLIFGTTVTAPTVSDVVGDIVDEISGDTDISSNKDLIETVGLTLIPFIVQDGELCYDALKTAVSYGDSNHDPLGWGVEDGGDRLFVKQPDLATVRYAIPMDSATRADRRVITAEDFLTEAWGLYRDEQGKRQFTDKYYAHIASSGITATTTSTGNDLASTIYNVKRSDIVDFETVQASLAIDALQQYLIDHAHPISRVSLSVQAPVQDLTQSGAHVEPMDLEVGYLCQIPWLRANVIQSSAGDDIRDWETTFLLTGLEYDHDSRTARLILERDTENYARMLAYIKAMRAGSEIIDTRDPSP